MTFDDEKIKAVGDFLIISFPGGQLSTRYDGPSRSQVFAMSLGGSTYTAMIRDDFFQQHPAAEIASKLDGFLLIEHLQDMPGTTFVVTPVGLEL